MKNVLLTAIKVLTSGVVFFFGTILGGQLASALGLPMPEMPKGTDPNILAGFLLLISLCIGALLSFLAVTTAVSSPTIRGTRRSMGRSRTQTL